MTLVLDVKLAIYGWAAETGTLPGVAQVSRQLGAPPVDVSEAFRELATQRLLVLEPDGVTIRMAPPFSAVPTQHQVMTSRGRYYANCAWDAFGVLAALKQPGEVWSRCEQSFEPLVMNVGLEGPPPSTWLFHSLVPAARWWEDIVFT